MRNLIDVINEAENTRVVMKTLDQMTDADYKEFLNDIKAVGDLSPKELLNKITGILKNVDIQTSSKLNDTSREVSDIITKSVKESLVVEGEGVKKSIKELIGELFPSLSFYPALGIWGMADQMIQSGQGFAALSPEQMRLLPIYCALFFGLIGGKIAWNRLKDWLKKRKDNQTEEVPVTTGQLASA